MANNLYSTVLWRVVRARALARDADTCTVARLFGGECSDGPLSVHHIVPVSEGGARLDLSNCGTVCRRHHPQWEALRRAIMARREPEWVTCPHEHRHADARAACERRLNRDRQHALVA